MTPAEASMPATAQATVLVVDDHALVRTGVANIISHEPDLQVVAEAANGVEAIAAFERHRPDVTLLDLRMPVMEGVEAVRQIRLRDPLAKVIVLTTYDTDEDITRALKAGAKAYILKDISATALVACIHDVLAGKTYLAPTAAAKLAEGVARVQLTPRELSTLRLVADGQSNKEIASALGISERTVKTHLGHLFEKLGVTSRTEAAKVAARRGLVRLE
jgi:two-component system NarL family response regulator